jgi:S1-C subfamily serine protease
MRRGIVLVLGLVGASPASAAPPASCVDPATLVRSAVSIERMFRPEEVRDGGSEAAGIRGTGWFTSPRRIVTAAHVAEAMRLSVRDWREIEVRERQSMIAAPARVLLIAGHGPEKIAVIELATSFPAAVALPLRAQPLAAEERLVSIAYPKGELRFAEGRFARYGDGGAFAGAALIEMYDGEDRLVIDHGASGAPVLDCEGRVVAVVSSAITQTIRLPTGPVRVSTAWHTPNVVAIPTAALESASQSE